MGLLMMAGRWGFLDTRVGRRVLVAFLATALLPMALGLGVAAWFVRDALDDQGAMRLSRVAKSVSLQVLASLSSAAHDIAATPARADGVADRDGLVELGDGEDRRRIARALSADAASHLRSGRLALVVEPAEHDATVWLADGNVGARRGRVFALRPALSWTPAFEVVAGEEVTLCILDVATRRAIRCSADASEADRQAIFATFDAPRERSGTFVTATHVVAFRDLFLRYEWASPDWRVVAAAPREGIWATGRSFAVTIAALLALGLVMAFMLGHIQIRRTTAPLADLRAAAERVAAGDLTTPVAVASRDEFGEVARAFNHMTAAIADQVSALEGLGAIDRAALGALAVGDVARVALDEARRVTGARFAGVAVLRPLQRDTLERWIANSDRPAHHAAPVVDAGARLAWLDQLNTPAVITATHESFVLLVPPGPGTPSSLLVMPLRHAQQLIGALAVGDIAADATAYDTPTLRRVTDRLSLALTNQRLVERLDALSIGTLAALARATEASSAWTAGHAERVTTIAMQLGETMGLSSGAIDTLYRGGLLHDIGKVGIPATVLDKDGPLTIDEWRLMRDHPVVGERILKPIPILHDVLPIVRSHHERRDGSGYPDGLAGDAIPLLARVVAVADVYDALTSDRPYRRALAPTDAVEYLLARPQEFDPDVLTAFRRVARNELLTARMAPRGWRPTDLPGALRG